MITATELLQCLFKDDYSLFQSALTQANANELINDVLLELTKTKHSALVYNLITKFPEVFEVVKKNSSEQTETYIQGYSLATAASSNHLDALKRLLEDEDMQKNATFYNNFALCEAIKKGHLDIVKQLIKVKSINETAGRTNNSWSCTPLEYAAQYDRIEEAEVLLQESEDVRKNAAEGHNMALKFAIEKSNFEFASMLFDQDAFKNHPANYAFFQLIRPNLNSPFGQKELIEKMWSCEIIREDILSESSSIDLNRLYEFAEIREMSAVMIPLLDKESIKDLVNQDTDIDKGNLRTLKTLEFAIKIKNIQLVNKLIEVKNLHSLLGSSLLQGDFKEYLLDIFIPYLRSAIENNLDNLSLLLLHNPMIIEKLNINATLYNELAQKAEGKNPELLSTIRTLIQENQQQFQQARLEQDLFLTEKEINSKYFAFKREKDELIATEQFANHSESAMDPALVRKAMTNFQENIEPNFKDVFESYGDTFDERLIKIERNIREKILKCIQKIAQEEKNTLIVEFIDKHTEELANGDADTMSKARELFIHEGNVAIIAWSCYDKGGVNQSWDNLFISPSEEAGKFVFNIKEVCSEPLTLKTASDLVREQVAYYFLMIQHDVDSQLQDEAMFRFVSYLAEAKRAHNETAGGIDNPSCLPGVITRIANIPKLIVQCKTNQSHKVLLDQIFKEHIFKITNDRFAQMTKDNATELLEAIIAYQDDSFFHGNVGKNLKKIYELKEYSRKHLNLRQEFIEHHLMNNNLNEFLQEMKEKMAFRLEEHEFFLHPIHRTYLEYILFALRDDLFLSAIQQAYSIHFEQNNEEKLGDDTGLIQTPFSDEYKIIKTGIEQYRSKKPPQESHEKTNDPEECEKIKKREELDAQRLKSMGEKLERVEKKIKLFFEIKEKPLSQKYEDQLLKKVIDFLFMPTVLERLSNIQAQKSYNPTFYRAVDAWSGIKLFIQEKLEHEEPKEYANANKHEREEWHENISSFCIKEWQKINACSLLEAYFKDKNEDCSLKLLP